VLGRSAACLLAASLASCVPNAAGSASAARAKPARPEKKTKRPDAATRPAARLVSNDAAPSAPGPPAATSTQGRFEELRYDFDRGELGADWRLTSSAWRIEQGRLCVQGARNHPAWLQRKLPVNARIEFDAVSSSPDGDIKVEVWGDGRSAAVSTSYTNASSYVVIFGGWKNSYHVLARVDEHAKDRPEVRVDPNGELRAQPVVPERAYHFKIERNDGKTVRWYVDDIEIIAFSDRAPLAGEGHEHLGFNNWETRVCFDNLHVVPL
jgi:hypothetical protein